MLAHSACVARGHFRDMRGVWVLVHVPTRSFFRLHTLDQNAMRIWARLSLQGYFELEAWGPDFRRAWEVVTMLNDRFRCRVTNLEGRIREIHITRKLVRRAWSLTEGQLTYNDRAHTEEDRQRCTAMEHPTWDDLHHQQIRLPLQLHTQHLQVTNPHRWSMGEKGVAIEYTN